MLDELELTHSTFGASYQDSTGRTRGQQTMSSLEIAELTVKEHRNVIRDIRAMLAELGDTGLSFERIYRLSFQPVTATP